MTILMFAVGVGTTDGARHDDGARGDWSQSERGQASRDRDMESRCSGEEDCYGSDNGEVRPLAVTHERHIVPVCVSCSKEVKRLIGSSS